MKRTHRRPTLAVLRSFTSWWLTWVVLGVYLVGLVLTVCLGWNHTRSSQTIPGDWSGTNWDMLPADLSKVESISINPIYLSKDPLKELEIPNPAGIREKAQKHYALRSDSPLRIPGKLPALKTLVLWGSVNEDQLVKLLEFQQLKSLYILHLEPLTDRGWSALEKQPIETLGILGLDLSTWNEAKWPQSLRRMLVQSNPIYLRDPAPSHLLPLVKLPHLEILKTVLWPNEEGMLREKDVEALSQMQSLKYLYLEYITRGADQKMLAQLPGITIRPTYYQSSRVSNVLVLTGLGLLPLLYFLHILSIQFINFNSSLIPGFKYHFWKFAIFLFVCGWAVQTAALMGVGCYWHSALSYSPVMLIPVFLFVKLFDQNHRFTGFITFAVIFGAFVLSMVLLSVLTMIQAPESDWFFQGNRTDVTLILLLAEAISAAGLVRFFHRLSKKITEHEEGAIPSGLFDFSNFPGNCPQKENSYRVMEKLWGRGQQTRLRSALACPFNSPAKQSLLWRASQPMTAAGFSFYMAMVALLSGIMIAVIQLGFNRIPIEGRGISVLWPIVWQPVAFAFVTPAILLAQRQPFLANHLLMSVTRRDWVRLVFWETALDFIPFLVVMALVLMGYWYWQPANSWPVWHVGLLLLGIVGLTYGVTLILMTLTLVGKVLFVLGSIGSVVVLLVLVIQIGLQDPNQGKFLEELPRWPPIFWIPALLLAALGFKIAHHRWMNWQMA